MYGSDRYLAGRLSDDLAAEPDIYVPKAWRAELEHRLGAVDRQVIVKHLETGPRAHSVCHGQLARGGRAMNYYQFHILTIKKAVRNLGPNRYSSKFLDCTLRLPLSQPRLVNIVHKQILSPFRTIFGVVTEQHMVEAEPQQLLRSQQRHAGLLGRAVALSLVALDARRHQILRRALAALGTRENVIQRQVLGVFVLAAILAAIAVANVDPGTLHRRFAVVAANVDIMPQPDHRRHRKIVEGEWRTLSPSFSSTKTAPRNHRHTARRHPPCRAARMKSLVIKLGL